MAQSPKYNNNENPQYIYMYCPRSISVCMSIAHPLLQYLQALQTIQSVKSICSYPVDVILIQIEILERWQSTKSV